MPTARTDQELFDTVVAHLRKQGAQALDMKGACVYRAPGGRKCAIGCLIADEDYSPELEGLLGMSARVREAAGLSADQRDLAKDLQDVHDLFGTSEWERGLEAVAKEFNLTYTEVSP